MKITLSIAKKLARLAQGESVPASKAKGGLIDELIAENIIYQKGKARKSLVLADKAALRDYLANQCQVHDLAGFIRQCEDPQATRKGAVMATTDSKQSKERAFKGFLANSYQPIRATLNGRPATIHPAPGSFVFVYDYESFRIPPEVTVVGIENAVNFGQIRQQQYLFEGLAPLFVARYPQSQHRDFIRWMDATPNPYLHFGDFDMAGIGIYLNEYKKHLGDQAKFFIPPGIQTHLRNHGNRARYHTQKPNFDPEAIQEPGLRQLHDHIHAERKGLDQEYYIR